MDRMMSIHFCLFFLLLFLSCEENSTENRLDPLADTDQDGLINRIEDSLGTNPKLVDSDGDGIWDGEEVFMFGTLPLNADSDNDSMKDREDPEPLLFNHSIPNLEYAIFTNNSSGTKAKQLTSTRHELSHVIYSPYISGRKQFIVYQRYLADKDLFANSDGKYDESDLPNSAIAIMNIDGSRPRLLTDLDENGRIKNNFAIDATPELSPDGNYIVFVSNRHDINGLNLKLYIMNVDAKNPRVLEYADHAPQNGEIDADPYWGKDNIISFKRENLSSNSRFSRVYTALINAETAEISNVKLRTDGNDTTLIGIAAGDYDPKISPNGKFLASYRHLGNSPGIFGDWDIWLGEFSNSNPSEATKVQFIDEDSTTANLFPRWDQSSTKIAVWTVHSLNVDPIDIFVFKIAFAEKTFSVLTKTNITEGDGWIETMPSWNTDPSKPDELIYSASR